MNSLRTLALLLATFLAPACAPDLPDRVREIPCNLVLLTDTTRWETGQLAVYKDSLTTTGCRVMISGYPGETAAEMSARLPWLLQAGVDIFLYDKALAGEAGSDSLINFLKSIDHPAVVKDISPETLR